MPQFPIELHQSTARRNDKRHRAHVWFEELISGRAASIVEIAEREGVSDRFVSIVLDLAFLAPSAVEAIVDGRFHTDMSAKKMMFDEDIPLRWSES